MTGVFFYDKIFEPERVVTNKHKEPLGRGGFFVDKLPFRPPINGII
jgi:hypothetical protein